ncbi:MAG TPA: NAD(+)/NADH kinase [Fimbriimonadaceae bacterium]|nr:NAD(+)/NADH kinase [Fimbriimonadaceae bacterium]
MNTLRPDAVQAAREATSFLHGRGAHVWADPDSGPMLEVPIVSHAQLAECELLVCFGGDGTLIKGAGLCSERGTPILGVYYGRFGFVTQCLAEELDECLTAFIEGRACIQERMMLRADLLRSGNAIAEFHALNEITMQRDVSARMLSFSVHVDGHFLTSYPADGVLLATPTGSTGYNLSAGGPIADPGVRVILLTAIAPHTLSTRPLVLSAESTIDLGLQTAGDAIITVDGQTRLHLLSGDQVRVTRSPRVTRLINVAQDDFLRKLSNRLFWSHHLARPQ